MGLFKLRADPELRAILCRYASALTTRKAGSILFRQGEKSHGLYVVKSGAVRLFIEASAGEHIIERDLGEGHIVGLPATFNGQPYSLSCEVTQDAELAYLSRRDVATLMRCETEVAMKLLDLLSSEVQAARSELARSPRSNNPGKGFRT